MPKTQINHPRTVQAADSPDSPGPGVPAVVDATLYVNWLKSPEGTGHVQLSLDAPVSYLRMLLEHPNGAYVDGSSLVWTPALTRHECNSLIQALRSARDGAYGRDE